jgi:RNA binding exosome subunit
MRIRTQIVILDIEYEGRKEISKVLRDKIAELEAQLYANYARLAEIREEKERLFARLDAWEEEHHVPTVVRTEERPKA